MINAKEYQEEIKRKLIKILSIDSISIEQRMNIPAYSPRIDIAIPPFAFERRYIEEYSSLLRRNRIFFDRLREKALNRDKINFELRQKKKRFL